MFNSINSKLKLAYFRFIIFIVIFSSSYAYSDDVIVNMGTLTVNNISTTGKVTIPVGAYRREGTPAIVNDDNKTRYDAEHCYEVISGGICLLKITANTGGKRDAYLAPGVRRGQTQLLGGGFSPLLPGDIMTLDLVLDNSGIKGSTTWENALVGKFYDDKNNLSGYLRFNATIIINSATCAVSTAHDMNFTWPQLSPSQIENGSAEVKNAPIGMSCSTTDEKKPVTVTVTSANGYANASDGVINTNKSNLGIKLTWADSGEVIPLNKGLLMNAYNESNFSINAKPVSTSSKKISAGDFETTVTISFDYH
ncbi:fimbrial protein [Hafnia alvei]|uniref:Pilin (Type 1 fimbria component protein) n=1 Tax=Hafnia alvei TaxID=569 RepID=A0A1C6YW39_HAFAL|nr:fimbrial protein [Hafnia alvei]NLS56146.1 fimbrial protein [Hafnia alvei]SCM51076.1 Pilin (type 1 fimbria component protein) [Hafnia alvei]